MPTPIALWSGPRNVSTALMYSFAQRDDTRVVDEPLYGHYLRVSGANHPGDDEVMAAMNCDGDAVVAGLMADVDKSPNVNFFIKHMAHHLVDLDLTFVNHCRNVFPDSRPSRDVAFLDDSGTTRTLVDTGLQRQWELLEDLQRSGHATVVLDSRELLTNPSAVLRELCTRLDMPYQSGMLHWPTGPRAEDGVWARHWYHAVHQSTGFAEYRPKQDFPDKLLALLEECQPWYDKLFAHAVRAPEDGE